MSATLVKRGTASLNSSSHLPPSDAKPLAKPVMLLSGRAMLLLGRVGGKWVELLKEAAPNITRVAYIALARVVRVQATGVRLTWRRTYLARKSLRFRSSMRPA
jgi:hypothetical protein